MSDLIKQVTDNNFEQEVMQSDTPVLVDFWAPWCGPCKMIAPLLTEMAEAFNGTMSICKIDVDENPETAQRFNVRGIPTLLIFKDGEIEATKVGGVSKTQLKAFIESVL